MGRDSRRAAQNLGQPELADLVENSVRDERVQGPARAGARAMVQIDKEALVAQAGQAVKVAQEAREV